MSKNGWVAVCVVILVAIVALRLGFEAGERSDGDACTIEIEISSTHVTQTVTVSVYVDGSQVSTTSLGPMASKEITYHYNVGSANSKTIIVKAVSTGGGLGTVSDSANLSVKGGSSYHVTLDV